MFKALQPLLQERSIHLLLSASKDGKIGVYVSPVKKNDKEDDAFVTPFRCEGTADELDSELAGVLSRWLATRSTVTASLTEALAAAEAQAKSAAEEAKKKAAEKNKKPSVGTSKPVLPSTKAVSSKAATPVMPSLLDGMDTDNHNEPDDDEDGVATASDAPAPSSAPVAESEPVVVASVPVVALSEPAAAPPVVAEPAAAVPAAVLVAEPVTEELF